MKIHFLNHFIDDIRSLILDSNSVISSKICCLCHNKIQYVISNKKQSENNEIDCVLSKKWSDSNWKVQKYDSKDNIKTQKEIKFKTIAIIFLCGCSNCKNPRNCRSTLTLIKTSITYHLARFYCFFDSLKRTTYYLT